MVGAVGLDWDATPGATRYAVFRRAGLTYSGTPAAVVTATEHVDQGRFPGLRECYVVAALKGDIYGAPSQEACAEPLAARPGLSCQPGTASVRRSGAFTVSCTTDPGTGGVVRVRTVRRFSLDGEPKHRFLLASKRFEAQQPTGEVKVRLRLNRTGRRLLTRKRRLKAVLAVHTDDGSASRIVTLRAPKQRR
jgi:hypothetical protein